MEECRPSGFSCDAFVLLGLGTETIGQRALHRAYASGEGEKHVKTKEQAWEYCCPLTK